MSYIIALAIAAGLGSARGEQPTRGTAPGLDTAQTKATPPVIVNFQGHLRQGATIINGTYSMTFRLYNAAVGGTLLQTMGPWNVNVSSGVFNVELPITQDYILNNTNLWVEVEIPSLGGIYTPRVKINSAAFAYNAYMSDSTQRIKDGAVTPQDLVTRPTGPNQWNDFDLNDNGRIDLALLDVPASGTDPGYIWNYQVSGVQQTNASFYIDLFGRAGNTAGKYGELNHASYGVYGQYNASNYGYLGGNGYGGYGYGSTYGMYARYSAANNYGYLGSASYGVYGYYNTGRYGYLGSASYGAYGQYDANNYGYLGGNGTGVYGQTNAAGSASAAGVRGVNPNNTGIAVLGIGQSVTATVPGTGCGVMGASDTFGVYGQATLLNASPNYSGAGVIGAGPGWTGTVTLVGGSGVTGFGYTGVFGYGPSAVNYTTGVYGRSEAVAGTGVAGIATGLWDGIYLPVGVYGGTTQRRSVAVLGSATGTDSCNGVYGQSPGTSGWAAVEGFATATNGVGAYFVGNNYPTGSVVFTDGGGAYGYDLNQGVCGLAYDQSTGSSEPGGIGAMCFGNTQTLSGYWAPMRGAGVSGYGEYLGVWGSEDVTATTPTAPGSYGILGYYGTTSVGVFGWASNATAYWAGYFDGPGTEGDVNITGDLYIDGVIIYYKSGGKDDKDYIPGLIATIPADDKSPLYAMYASDAKVYFDGQGRLKNGEAFIKIPEDIAKVIAGNAQVVVTPVGSWSGIYVAEIRNDGFLVKSGAGDPNAEFKWIAVAERKGTENGKADVLVAQKLEKLSQKVTPPEFLRKTPVYRPTKTFQGALGVSDRINVKANIQSAPADPENRKEVK